MRYRSCEEQGCSSPLSSTIVYVSPICPPGHLQLQTNFLGVFFYSFAPYFFLLNRFIFQANLLRKKDRIVRAPKGCFVNFRFFVELLHSRVYGAKFMEQSQTPPWTPSIFETIRFTILSGYEKGFS